MNWNCSEFVYSQRARGLVCLDKCQDTIPGQEEFRMDRSPWPELGCLGAPGSYQIEISMTMKSEFERNGFYEYYPVSGLIDSFGLRKQPAKSRTFIQVSKHS